MKLQELAHRILALPSDRIQKVGIDGVDGAGKTTLADHLASFLKDQDRPILRASVDGFHNPREIRYLKGRTSPEGFYRDSYNYDALKQNLLEPLSQEGPVSFLDAIFDVNTNLEVKRSPVQAPSNAILIFDGIFLHRPELRHYWDLSIFLKVDFEVSIPRGAQRGFGSPDPQDPSNFRYIEGQKLYFSESEPEKHASIVLEYNQPDPDLQS